jgi:hypothetical protein
MTHEPKRQEIVIELEAEQTAEGFALVLGDADETVAGPVSRDRSAGGDETVAGPAEAPDNAARETQEALPERLVLAAEREIVLQVGKASVTLTAAGKIILRGTYVSSRSSGVNRIRGGSVEIN